MVSPLKTTHMTVHVTIRISPDNIEPFLAALRPVWAACCREPECIYFDVFHLPTEPGTFRFVEVWTKDETWFKDHQLTKSYYEAYLAATKPMWIVDREITYSERVDGWNYVGDDYLEGSLKTV